MWPTEFFIVGFWPSEFWPSEAGSGGGDPTTVSLERTVLRVRTEAPLTLSVP